MKSKYAAHTPSCATRMADVTSATPSRPQAARAIRCQVPSSISSACLATSAPRGRSPRVSATLALHSIARMMAIADR
eukprot:scaffold9180_cov35-Tisochrysis_lutea.AAC.3